MFFLVAIPLLLWTMWFVVIPWIRQAALRKLLPGPPVHSFLKGNIAQLYDTQNWKFHVELMEKYGKVVKIAGFMGDTRLYVSDPRAIHNIMVKDLAIWDKEAGIRATNQVIEGVNITSTSGEHHRRHRKLLNPAFNVTHMKYMVPTFSLLTRKFVDVLGRQVGNGPTEIDMLHWMSRISLELIGTGGLGYSFNALDENATNAYGEALTMIIPTITSIRSLLVFLPWAVRIGSPGFRSIVARSIPWKPLQTLIGMTDVMEQTSKEILKEKRAALEKDFDAVAQETAEGKDIMSILLQANVFAPPKDRIPESELLAQMSALIFAGMDTTSSAVSRVLHLLSEHPEVQEQLRHELDEAFEGREELEYDELQSLPVLDAVCRESLRLYPPVPYLIRTNREDVVLPLGTPISTNNGKSVSELFIPSNTDAIISILSVNRDPQIWGPDALEWKPSRWLNGLPSHVLDARIPGVYANTMTFSAGSKSCLGFKFAQMEMKMVLSRLVMAFNFTPSNNKIYWTIGGISKPIPHHSKKPEMPLVVSRRCLTSVQQSSS